jgi:hypothetical protein
MIHEVLKATSARGCIVEIEFECPLLNDLITAMATPITSHPLADNDPKDVLSQDASP